MREFNRQTDERKQAQRAASRRAAGLPPFDATVSPATWPQFVEYLRETN